MVSHYSDLELKCFFHAWDPLPSGAAVSPELQSHKLLGLTWGSLKLSTVLFKICSTLLCYFYSCYMYEMLIFIMLTSRFIHGIWFCLIPAYTLYLKLSGWKWTRRGREETVAMQQLLCIRHRTTKMARLGCTIPWFPPEHKFPRTPFCSTHSPSAALLLYSPFQLLPYALLFCLGFVFSTLLYFLLFRVTSCLRCSYVSVWNLSLPFVLLLLLLRLLFCVSFHSCHSLR